MGLYGMCHLRGTIASEVSRMGFEGASGYDSVPGGMFLCRGPGIHRSRCG